MKKKRFEEVISRSSRTMLVKAAKAKGFESLGTFIDEMLSQSFLDDDIGETKGEASSNNRTGDPLVSHFSSEMGEIVHGNSLAWLQACETSSVDLVMTSPPFGLLKKKAYGNSDEHTYIDWFEPFARQIKRVLRDRGSFVLDIGGAWRPGMPVKSIYNFKLLVHLVEDLGFYLSQDHYWWNPSRLPTPAQWVNVERTRVKDAVNTVWWLSKTPFPKASNKRILNPYSLAMRKSLDKGYGVAQKRRPSGHSPSAGFSVDNGGAIPPNLLAIVNSVSKDKYVDFCKENGWAIHPARFPSQLPEYFIRFLTNKGDLVVDRFAGSCVTGEVAERLGRRWVCIEVYEEYLKGAVGRFQSAGERFSSRNARPKVYEIYSPQFKSQRRRN